MTAGALSGCDLVYPALELSDFVRVELHASDLLS